MDHTTSTVFSLQQPLPPPPSAVSPLPKLILVASIAAGVQFGWALQLSLLTPYVQLLGIPHKWASLIWLCGPISGMLVQPIVGFHSDNCTSRFGRRRPFIAAGALMVAIAVVLIGYAADLGHRFGDNPGADNKPRAVVIFVFGFWILDVANNTLQGPCRALLADLSGNDQRRMRMSNSLFSFFMAVGNVLGFAAGSHTHLHRLFPFTTTIACDVYCANLKSCFFFSILLLVVLTVVALALVREEQWSPEPVAEGVTVAPPQGGLPFFAEIFGALKELKKPMRVLLLVTCLNWIAWFPFLLFDTDWMGREVYGGASQGNSAELKRLYNNGVRAGALGLMVNSVVLGLTSLVVEPAARAVGGVKRLWGGLNFLLALCLAMTVLVTKMAESDREFTIVNGVQVPLPPSTRIRGGALALFAALGVPLAITYSIPFAMASIYSSTSGAGQGLSLGVLNLAIVVPQIVVSLGSGPFDAMFGGGNLPAFVFGAAAATASGMLALTMLPSPPPDTAKTLAFGTHP